jgi:hypothetical protein
MDAIIAILTVTAWLSSLSDGFVKLYEEEEYQESAES